MIEVYSFLLGSQKNLKKGLIGVSPSSAIDRDSYASRGSYKRTSSKYEAVNYLDSHKGKVVGENMFWFYKLLFIIAILEINLLLL